MKNIIGLLALVLLYVASTTAHEPKFCQDKDCPEFTGYEVRHYLPSKWIGTTVKSLSYVHASYVGFEKLFRYILGNNSYGMMIPMTVPVASKIFPLGDGISNYTTLFFVPFLYQSRLPMPIDRSIVFTDLPAMKVYVKSFGGFTTNKLLRKNLRKLKEEIRKDKLDYVEKYYFAATYSDPYTSTNRRNEVWLMAK